jgi:hypothetical protein
LKRLSFTSFTKLKSLSIPLDCGLGRLSHEQIDREDDDHPDQHAQDLRETLRELGNKPSPARGHSLFEAQDGKSDLAKVQVDISDSCQSDEGKWNRQTEGPEYGSEWCSEFNHGNLLSSFA